MTQTQSTRSVKFKGTPMTLVGSEIKVGQRAPDFTAVTTDLKEARLKDYHGKLVILSFVPSLDTPVCSRQTRRFNEEAASLGASTAVVTVSMDLPFAQKRWCAAEGMDRVVTLSDHRDASFGRAFGVLVKELRLLARGVAIVDRDGTIRYLQIVPEMTDDVDFDAALTAARNLIGK